MLKKRSEDILESAIREFIETGEPVSSFDLYKKYNFGIRPAMIRLELTDLTDKGYLEQPYHSAGRIPANRGYEFFAEKVKEREIPKVSGDLSDLFMEGDVDRFLSCMSAELQALSVAYENARTRVIKEGLDALMSHLEWQSKDEALNVIRDFEAIDERILETEREPQIENILEIFIGRKSPVTRSDDLAVFTGTFRMKGKRTHLFVISPKRMDYGKAARIFKGLKQLEKNN